MSSQRPRRRQKNVLRLEAKRATATISCVVFALIVAAVSVSASLYPTSAWPQSWHLPASIPPRVTTIVSIVAAVLAVLLLAGAIINGRRWRLAHLVERLSRDPYLVRSMPGDSPTEYLPRAQLIPPLEVELLKPRRLPRPRPLGHVTNARNVTGGRPLSIAYLRLFENQPRTRTFIQGAWREFGYVHFLRSAASVTPSEFRQAKSKGNLDRLFLISREQFLVKLAQSPLPSAKHWRAFKDIGPSTIRVWDRYGSYSPKGYLCHGTIWKPAVDELLGYVDLVALDLSGFMPHNLGTGYELQRVVDRFPIERVVFLADAYSDRGFLRNQILNAWQNMADGSPNSGTRPRTACLAVTDYYHRSRPAPVAVSGPTGGQVAVQQGPEQVRLEASRRESRRLAAEIQRRGSRAQLPGLPRAQPSSGSRTPTTPVVRPSAESWRTETVPSQAESKVSPPRTDGFGEGMPARTTSPSSWPGPAASGAKAPVARLAGKIAALGGAIIFLASVMVFANYTNLSTTGQSVSLLHAIHGDPASPLHPHDFWIPVGLLATASICTLIGMLVTERSFIIIAVLAALGLVGYTLYIPTINSDGFAAYSSSYWVSLVAAVLMTVGTIIAAVTRAPAQG